jgi:hypothetical protein
MQKTTMAVDTMNFPEILAKLATVERELFDLACVLRKEFDEENLEKFKAMLNSVQNPEDGSPEALCRDTIRSIFIGTGVAFVRLLSKDLRLRPLVLWTGGREIAIHFRVNGIFIIQWNRRDGYDVTKASEKQPKDHDGFTHIRRSRRRDDAAKHIQNLVKKESSKEIVKTSTKFDLLGEMG